jgi:thioester reductase-like protein
MSTTLITGATGFVGRELARRLLERHPTRELCALIRGRDEQELQRRRAQIVAGLPAAAASRLRAVQGDLVSPGLGLSPADAGELRERVDRVVHVAATVRFDHPLEEARRINVGGTAQVLALCREIRARGRSGRLDYVGTAFVAGSRSGLAREDDLDVGQGFRNTYERSKLEAEQLCREAGKELPVAIHRPAIVVGDSRSGATTSFNTIYWPMKLLVALAARSGSLLPRLLPIPLRPDCTIDIVPVDWVAEAMCVLYASERAEGRCHQLAAGPRAPTIRDLVELGCQHLGVPALRFAEPDGLGARLGARLSPLGRRAAPRFFHNAGLILAYTRENPRFDVSNTLAAGLEAPDFRDFFRRILDFAIGAKFGRGDSPPSGAPSGPGA